jgi:hypothetical protein
MQKSKAAKLVTSLFLISSLGAAQAANSFDEAIKNATTSGQIRLGYISSNPDTAGSKTTTATAIGGKIKFETAEWKRMQFAIAPYFSEKLESLSGDQANAELNTDFFDSNGDSYAYLGEAYVNYAFNKGSVRFGRQTLDNPFINTDEIRMHPNTFRALWLNMNLSDNLTLDAGLVTQMAGFDSGRSQDKFKRVSNDGVSALGLTYKMKAHHTFQGWYYDFNDQYSQAYLDAAYENGNFSAGLQYSKYDEVNNSNINGSVWGVTASYTLADFTFALAINESSNDAGESASLGLGGGNYFAAMDEMTIGDLTNASAQVVSIEYAATDNLTASLAVGQFEDDNKTTTDTSETDFVLAYSVNEKLDVEFVHAVVDNKADASASFSRNFARVNYSF